MYVHRRIIIVSSLSLETRGTPFIKNKLKDWNIYQVFYVIKKL